MTTKQIDAMLSEVVKTLDEDIWKDVYGPHPEDAGNAKETRAKLRLVALDHLPKPV